VKVTPMWAVCMYNRTRIWPMSFVHHYFFRCSSTFVRLFFLLKEPSFDFRFRDTRHRHLRIWHVCIRNGHAGDTGQRRQWHTGYTGPHQSHYRVAGRSIAKGSYLPVSNGRFWETSVGADVTLPPRTVWGARVEITCGARSGQDW